MIYEKAYAKINLALEVGEVIDGFHQVNNLMIPINLYDELFFQKSADLKLDSETDIEDNICLRAAKLFIEHFHIEGGASIILNKNIPIMAGLAGGSSDAAATLRGLNRLYEVNASFNELYDLACELGSDVPFFLYNKLALCTGRGEVIKPLELSVPSIPFLLVKPGFGLSTKEIYQNYIPTGQARTSQINRLIEALKSQDMDQLDDLIFNDLEEVALSVEPELKKLFTKIDALSYKPHISGSGPSIFILNARAIDLEYIKELDDTLALYLCHTV